VVQVWRVGMLGKIGSQLLLAFAEASRFASSLGSEHCCVSKAVEEGWLKPIVE